MIMNSSIHKVKFLNFIAPTNFLKFLDYSSYSKFSCTWLGNVQNTAGVNHPRCCAIAEVLWNRSRFRKKKLKIVDGYVIAATFTTTYIWVHTVCRLQTEPDID